MSDEMHHVFKASHPGICGVCDGPWERGDAIRLGYNPQRPAERRAVWMHLQCSRMSDAEKAARTVPPSVPEDQRQEVVNRATSRIESSARPHLQLNHLLAEAWDDGYVAGQVDMSEWERNGDKYTKNPYREADR